MWQSSCIEERTMKVSAEPETSSQLALLHRISGIVSSDMSLQKMLNELIGLVVGVTDCDACLVFLLEASRDVRKLLCELEFGAGEDSNRMARSCGTLDRAGYLEFSCNGCGFQVVTAASRHSGN